jgi:hypothetical protein
MLDDRAKKAHDVYLTRQSAHMASGILRTYTDGSSCVAVRAACSHAALQNLCRSQASDTGKVVLHYVIASGLHKDNEPVSRFVRETEKTD